MRTGVVSLEAFEFVVTSRKTLWMTYTLLEDAAHEAASFLGEVLERCCRRVAVQTAHGDAEQGAAGEKLLICLAETRSLFICRVLAPNMSQCEVTPVAGVGGA